MKKLFLKRYLQATAIAVVTCFPMASIAQIKDLTQYVDPLIGTAHSRWFFFTPGAAPFGMAKPAPSTNGSYGNAGGWEAVGYDYRHTSIEGFANFHEFQVGGVVFAPITGKLQTVPGKMEKPEDGYRSNFDRKDEYATAGYYSVILKDYNIKAELTATPRVAFHKYTFPAGKESHILFDIGNKQGESGEIKDAKVYMTADGRIEGYVITRPVYVLKYQPDADVAMYFSAIVDKKPDSFGIFKGEQTTAGQKEVTGRGAGLYLTFTTKDKEPISIKAGLSYTSISNARLNLQSESSTMTFDQAKVKSHDQWNEYLSRITVESPKKDDMVKFYTGLYHSLLGRGLASDVNGAYPKNDGSIGQIPLSNAGRPQYNHYNTDAIWGAFWNLTQLWAIAYPEYYSDYVKSQILIYKDAGWLGDGVANSKFVSGVGTNFQSLAIASAYAVGIRDFDIATGYAAAKKNELDGKDRPRGAGKLDVAQFVDKGYIPHIDKGTGFIEAWQFSASHTLEYSFSTYALAQWAKALGKTKDHQQFDRLSKGWQHLYDPKLKLVHPKLANGQFMENFKPSEAWRGFQEGNAYQYTYYVPHDPAGLIGRIGKERFNARLDSVFVLSQKQAFGGGTKIDAFAGLEGLYNQGNQPNLHIAWMFNYSGKPSLTQKWVRAICDEFYGTEGIHGYGYGQDEDQGQLGAWYVISSMGLFDVKGLTDSKPMLGLGSPLFNKITIKLNNKYYSGKQFVIEAKSGSATNSYVKRYTLNGRTLHAPFINFADVTKGGKLVLDMTATPTDKY